jgi:GNAT superfamily N-acetyltransferase
MSGEDEMKAEPAVDAGRKVSCRSAVLADVPALTGLLAELMRHLGVSPPEASLSAPSFDHAIRSGAQPYLLAADTEGNAVGMCGLLLWWDPWTGGRACELRDLVVTAAFRRRGVGTALLEAAARLARERGCTRLYVFTEVWGESGPAFYRGLGFHDKAALYFEKGL